MRNRFHSINDLKQADLWLTSYLLNRRKPITDRLLYSTKLTDLIYKSFLLDDSPLELNLNYDAPNLSKLSEDLFSALLSPVIKRHDEQSVFLRERVFNKPILEEILRNDYFDKLKELCEDRELPSYEAVSAFIKTLQENLSHIQTNIPELRFLSVINTLSMQVETDIKKAEQYKSEKRLDKLLYVYNRIDKKLSQIRNLEKKLTQGIICYVQNIKDSIDTALENAIEQASQVHNIMSAWGDCDSEMKNTPVNRELLDHVKNSDVLQKISKTLGRYREIIANKRKNAYSYGLGEKYDLTMGNDITNCLSSELALLGTAETEILFMRKYEQKRLAQYRKRTAIVKGDGDKIVLVDESGSTKSVASWAKAFALAILDIAAKDKRKFALIHFSSANQIKTDLFEPGHYKTEDIMKAAEHFFGDLTDFETPLKEAVCLMENGFENADITIITDGECNISNEFAESFKDTLRKKRASMTGILLDKGGPCGKTLEQFCDSIYHSKEITEDEIAVEILNRKAS